MPQSHPRVFILWNVFALGLNVALMIYLPYTFFFFESLPPLAFSDIITTTFFILFQMIEIMMKLQAQTFQPKKRIEEGQILQQVYVRKGLLLDALSIVSLVSIYVSNNHISILRLLIYCKIPSVSSYDRYISTTVHSTIVQFGYTLIRITLIYLTFCNLTAGAFFKLDYSIYFQQGQYYQAGEVWLLSAASMPNIIDWSYPVHYLYSMYWSIITACTIGYGDITPLNPYEVILVMFIFVPNILFYGFLIDNVNLRFAKLQEVEETVIESELAILRTLRDAEVDQKQLRFFKFYIRKIVQNQFDTKSLINASLSNVLKAKLNVQLFRDPLKKLNYAEMEDAQALCLDLYEHVYQKDQVIYPESKYFYIIQGKGEVILSGLDPCCYQESKTTINTYYSGQTLNVFNFVCQNRNPFIQYESQTTTKVYQITEYPRLQSLRLRYVQIAIQKDYSMFGVQCQICNTVQHPTFECSYLSFTTVHKRVQPSLLAKENVKSNQRDWYKRHHRQNQKLISYSGFRKIQFQQKFSNLCPKD